MEVMRLKEEKNSLDSLVREREGHVHNQTNTLEAKRAKLLEAEAEFRNLQAELHKLESEAVDLERNEK